LPGGCVLRVTHLGMAVHFFATTASRCAAEAKNACLSRWFFD
jgi:hypothetical protein